MSEELKFEDAGEVKNFEVYQPSIYVGVYFYENSDTPFALTDQSKDQLIKSFSSFKSIDKTRPIRIFKIIL